MQPEPCTISTKTKKYKLIAHATDQVKVNQYQTRGYTHVQMKDVQTHNQLARGYVYISTPAQNEVGKDRPEVHTYHLGRTTRYDKNVNAPRESSGNTHTRTRINSNESTV